MREKILREHEIEAEIERLRKSEYVRLAEKEVRLKNRRRNYMNTLRWMERRGKELAAQGITLELMELQLEAMAEAEQRLNNEESKGY